MQQLSSKIGLNIPTKQTIILSFYKAEDKKMDKKTANNAPTQGDIFELNS